MEYVGFCGGSYESQSKTAAQMQTVNWYPERAEDPNATMPWSLYPTPGVTEISEHSSGPGRAHFWDATTGREFAVIGSDFVEIDQAGTITDRGDVAIDGNPATICSNGAGGDQLLVTSGTNAYIFNLTTNTLTAIAALAGLATMGAHLDGYFLVLNSATSTWYFSALLDGTSFTTGTDFIQRSAQPDPWLALAVHGVYIFLLGSETSEVWYNAGTSPNPFAKHPSGSIPFGIAAQFGFGTAPGWLSWLGASKAGRGFFLRASGLAPEIISTYPLQNEINDYSTVSDAVCDVYNDRGHTFLLAHFPAEDKTHCWDAETLLWHGRGTWVSESNQFISWRVRYHAQAFGEHRFLDASTGSVYSLDYSAGALDVDDREIRRVRRAPAVVDQNRLVTYPGVEVLLESGLGTSGQGEDPQVMFRFSRDGGHTWGDEIMRSAGKTGEYTKRVRVERIGQARQLVMEISVSDPILWRIVGAFLDPDPIRVRTRAA